MKRLLVIIFLLITFKVATAQEVKQNRIYSAVNSGDFPIGVGYALDSGAKVVSYIQGFPNLPSTNFILIQDAQYCRFELTFKKEKNIKDYYFTLTDELTDHVILSGDINSLTNHNWYEGYGISGRTLPVISLKEKIVRLTVYNKLKPSELITVILYNQILNKAEVFSMNFFYKGAVGMENLDKQVRFDDKTLGIHIQMKKKRFPYIYSLKLKEKKSNKVVFKERVWNHDYYGSEDGQTPYMIVNKSYFENSGDYEIIIQPELNGLSSKEAKKYSTTRTIHVEVPRVYSNRQMLILGFFTPVLIIGISLLTIFWFRRRNARIVHEKSIQKKITDLKLESVRSQLNPHFLFNALSTIQGLINNSEVDKANLYLTKFARLTRSVLERENTHSVQDEMKLLDDYLQMEQLRYSFKYQIKAIDLDEMNIEIPSMLIQPIVENAVKHGVADLGERGNIEIDFARQNNDLSIQIKDNGMGFKISETVSGLGLNLTKEKVHLLNETYGQETVFLSFDFNLTGTVVSLNFKNWL